MDHLTVQLYAENHWHDAAQLSFSNTQQLLAVPDLLQDLGLPDKTWQHPRIPLRCLQQQLTAWELC